MCRDVTPTSRYSHTLRFRHTGESTWDHPCDEYYRKLYEEEKKKKMTKDKAKHDKSKQQVSYSTMVQQLLVPSKSFNSGHDDTRDSSKNCLTLPRVEE